VANFGWTQFWVFNQLAVTETKPKLRRLLRRFSQQSSPPANVQLRSPYSDSTVIFRVLEEPLGNSEWVSTAHSGPRTTGPDCCDAQRRVGQVNLDPPTAPSPLLLLGRLISTTHGLPCTHQQGRTSLDSAVGLLGLQCSRQSTGKVPLTDVLSRLCHRSPQRLSRSG